jgi:uncharacterized BrkB/YihY/UPF0761 family membrane protein
MKKHVSAWVIFGSILGVISFFIGDYGVATSDDSAISKATYGLVAATIIILIGLHHKKGSHYE